MTLGIIYKIEHRENPDIRYIGSTTNELRYRWRSHKDKFKKYLKGEGSKVAIYHYFKEFGIEKFTISMIKTYQIVDRRHLHAIETLWMNKLKNVNKKYPFNPIPKETIKIWRQNNKEKIAERVKLNDQKTKKQRIDCECGKSINKAHSNRHKKTIIHQKYIAML